MMRKTWWMAAGLALFLGCSGEPGADGGNPAPVVPSTTSGEGAPPAVSEGGAGGAPAAPADAPKPDMPPADAPKADMPKAADAGGDAALKDEEIAEIKKLPAGDQAQALAQKICPVSGHNLGSMETPVKVTTDDGQTGFLCCEGCMPGFKKDPKGTLAKLKK
jgi:YHS domain-containing protein